MLLSTDIKPTYSPYYIGGLIIYILKEKGEMEIDLVIEKILKMFKEKISVNYIYLGFDFLYLLSLVDIKEGKIMLCN